MEEKGHGHAVNPTYCRTILTTCSRITNGTPASKVRGITASRGQVVEARETVTEHAGEQKGAVL